MKASAMIGRRFSLLTLAVALSGAGPAAPAEDGSLESHRKKIEAAFRSGSPRPLLEICSTRDRIFLSLPGTGIPEGYLTRDQLHFQLERLFSRRRTVAFRFPPIGEESGRQARFGTARWEFREGGRKDTQSMNLRFGFSRRGEGWTLSEIRAAG